MEGPNVGELDDCAVVIIIVSVSNSSSSPNVDVDVVDGAMDGANVAGVGERDTDVGVDVGDVVGGIMLMAELIVGE